MTEAAQTSKATMDGSGTARNWKPLIWVEAAGPGPLVPLVSEITCDVVSAMKVPIANWPTPPSVFCTFSSSVTELVAVAVTVRFDTNAPEAFTHHSNKYC